jgi:hypothetical protein
MLKNPLRRLLGSVFAILLFVFQIQGMEHIHPNWGANIHRIEDGFYVGKIKGRDLWLVMERVDDVSRDLWLKYITVQTNRHAVSAARGYKGRESKPIAPEFNDFGSKPFGYILKSVDRSKNEVWVAYVTTNPTPKPITAHENERINSYSLNYLPQSNSLLPYKGEDYDPHKFPGNILMFVTITTSPNALITSHMGVSASIEGIYQRKDKIGFGISMDLHSFAAKVMLMRFPDRKYMINVPVIGMEKIIAQALPPGTVFAGTREMKKLSDDFKKMTIEEYKITHKDVLEEKLRFHSGKSIEDFFRDDKEYYINSQGFAGWEGVDTLEKLMKEHPPLLSVDGEKGRKISQQFTVFDMNNPNEPSLTVKKDEDVDNVYDFMFNNVTTMGLQDHPILVNLRSLADSRQLAP